MTETALATTEQTAAASAFLLDDQGTVHLVIDGRVDVFAISRRDGESDWRHSGPRRHLWTATSGAALFGFDLTAASAMILAVPSANTQLRRSTVADVVAQGERTTHRAGVATMVDSFLSGVGAAVGKRAMPPVHAAIAPDHSEVLRSGQRLGAARDPVWIRIERGTAIFGGDDRLAVDCTTPLNPIAAGAWLEAREDFHVVAEGTASVLEADGAGLWRGLHAASGVFLAWVEGRLHAEEAEESAQLRRKSSAEVEVQSRGFAQLAGVFAGANAAPAEGGDVLMQVLTMIGEQSRVVFRAAPRWEGVARTSDPLGAICRASRVRHRQVALRGTWWRSDGGALLGFSKGARVPVALLPVRGGGYERVASATGTRERITLESARTLEPVAYTFYTPAPERPLGSMDLLRLAFGDLRAEASMVVALALGAALLGLIVPAAIAFMFSSVIPSASIHDVVVLMVALIAVNIGQALFELVRVFALLRLEGRSHATLQAALVDRMLSLPVPFFRKYTVGDLASRAGGINALRDLFSGVAVNSILSGVFAVVYLGLLFAYAWKLALIAAGLVALSAIVTTACGVRMLGLRRDEQEAAGKLWGLVFQLINGIAKLRVSGSEGRAFAQWSARFAAQKRLSVRAGALQNFVQLFNAILPLVASAILFFFVGSLHDESGNGPLLSTGEFVAFTSAFGIFLRSGISLSGTVVHLLGAVPIMERAKPILQVVPEASADHPDPGELTGRIEVAHVSFRYAADGPLVLHDLSFATRPGEFIAFVGPSGSGKSTMLRLLLGFEPPETGAVLYDGQDLSTVDLTAVRAQLGVVLQNGRIMAGDIFHNIIGAAPLTAADAWEAATMAGMEEDIKAMPMGIYTVLSEGGTTLSGGQRQRLLIARAIVQKPRIILFDEATSALDNRTQDLVTDSLARINATRVVVAHRLSTIRNADCIYVMDAGRLVQQGTFEELVSQQGLFEQLVRRQVV
ncbi:MAG: transporter related [Gemmatimonadetes bacterium]|nr:transporter related [Gemmatimonadota bacterium]